MKKGVQANLFESMKDFIKNIFKSRLIVLAVVMAILFIILIQRIFSLQIINGKEYLDQYSLKIQKTRVINSTRGCIYDCNGELLAYNELAYSVTIEDNGSYTSTSEKNQTLNKDIANVITILDKNGDAIDNTFDISLNDDGTYSFNVNGTALQRFRADVYGRSTTDNEKFVNYNKTLGYTESEATVEQIMDYLCSAKKFGLSEDDYTADDFYRILVIRYAMSENAYQKYIVTTIASNVSDETVAYVSENAIDMQGITVSEDTVRKYVDSEYFAHIIGYTGKISQEEYDTLHKDDDSYSLTDVIGKSGIEQVMNSELQGTKGSETVYVDNVGKVVETKERTEPSAGNDVYLSINKELQEAVYKLLEQEIAGIVYSKVENIKEYNATESSDDIVIPIDDVYYALINNNVIRTSHFSEDDASSSEQAVLATFNSKQSSVLNDLSSQLTSASPAVYSELSDEQQTYMAYIVTMLQENSILLSDSIDTSDDVYLNWKNNKISLFEYLNHAISEKWIDITKFPADEEYSDSTEIYNALVNYIIDELSTDSGFGKKIYKYMINQNLISGTQLCLILYDQNVLTYDENEVAALSSGSESAFSFMKAKIKSLEITPAQLALDPCSGSCVITNTQTGELLACVTYPGYDNNRLANTVDSDYFAALNDDLSLPLYNYATQQKTAPGSTFKMVTATAGLTEGALSSPTETIEDLGQFTKIPNGPKCWIFPGSHGIINVSEALRDSCNYFFYEVGYRLSTVNGVYNDAAGVAKINKYSSLYGLDKTTGIEISESEPQQTTEYPITSAIGQSNNSFTTTQLARYVTAVANSGTVYNYTLLKKVTDSNGNTLQAYAPTIRNTLDMVSSSTWEALHSGMRMVVETHAQFDGMTVAVAGKTGTAQQISTRPNHALFVGYAPYDNPTISIATRIAYGYTSSNAAQVSASILKYYFKLEDEATLITGEATDVEGTTNSFTD